MTEGCRILSLVICLTDCIWVDLTLIPPVEAATGCVQPISGLGEGRLTFLVVLKEAINHPLKKTPPESEQHP